MPLTPDVQVRRRVSRQAIATAERRDQILDAAVEAFTETGFNGASIRDIATRAGMSHTGVLHHFPDKVAILEAVLDRRVERATKGLELDPRDPALFLRGLLALAAQDVAHPHDLRMFRIISAESLAPSHPAHGYMKQWYHDVRAAILEALENLRSRGHYIATGVGLTDAAAQIAGLRDGLDPQWILDPDSIDLVACMRAQLRLYTDCEL